MKKISTFTFALLSLSTLGFTWPFAGLFTPPNNEAYGSSAWIQKEAMILKSQAGNIDENVLTLSLHAYVNARRQGFDNKQLLTVVDYTQPSNQKRLWVFDIRTGRELFNTFVSHGKNSGEATANSFSNQRGSLKSSLGVFITVSPYVGNDGYSLRLRGLENGINDNAYRRNIVMHGARYVDPDIIQRYGEAGRSWGCLAVSENLAAPIINTIKDNTVVFAYYPDRQWLSHSRYLV